MIWKSLKKWQFGEFLPETSDEDMQGDLELDQVVPDQVQDNHEQEQEQGQVDPELA